MLSVVIAARNAEEWIGDQLEALSRQLDEDCEVVLADNGSTDRTNDVFRRYAENAPNQWSVVDASAVLGPSYARNAGTNASRGELLLFLDADDVIAPGYITAMRDALSQREFVAARLEDATLNEAWTKPKSPLPQLREIPIVFGFLPSPAGASLGMRRSVFDSVGGFDPDFLGSDDIDFSWRAQLLGTDVTLVTEAMLHYRYRNSLSAFFRQGLRDGLDRPALYRKFRDQGMPGRSWRSVPFFYGRVFAMAWRTRTRADLAQLYRAIGVRLGLLRGCIKCRVFYV